MQYSFKLKADTASAGSSKQKAAMHQGVNYLYRCELPRTHLRPQRQEGPKADQSRWHVDRPRKLPAGEAARGDCIG